MKKNFVIFPALALGLASVAFGQAATPTKIGIIKVADAIQETKDGQKASAALNARFGPRKADFDKRQTEIQSMQEQLRKGGATLSEERQAKLKEDIDTSTKRLNRDTEDAQTELDQEQNKVMQELGAKMMEIVIKYGTDNGYAVIVDVSNPQTPILWAASGIDITNDIVKLYDAKYGVATTTSAAPPAAPANHGATAPAKPAAAPGIRPPAAPPATKK
ncbi:MAG: OmpH family outer membrane protein [Acidobacteriia bacterium]|nr:OmpH family outer membrane protein [Terriglobia bacterium]